MDNSRREDNSALELRRRKQSTTEFRRNNKEDGEYSFGVRVVLQGLQGLLGDVECLLYKGVPALHIRQHGWVLMARLGVYTRRAQPTSEVHTRILLYASQVLRGEGACRCFHICASGFQLVSAWLLMVCSLSRRECWVLVFLFCFASQWVRKSAFSR